MVQPDATVADVLQAEQKLGRNHAWSVICLPSRESLPLSAKVAGLVIGLVPNVPCNQVPALSKDVPGHLSVTRDAPCDVPQEDLVCVSPQPS